MPAFDKKLIEHPQLEAYLDAYVRPQARQAERTRIYQIVEGACRTWDISKGGFGELAHTILEEIKKDI